MHNWLIFGYWLIGVGFSAFVYLATTRSNEDSLSTIFNSDSLFLPVLFRELLSYKGDFSAWHYSPAPFIFPEYLFQWIGSSLTSDNPTSMAIYSIIQIYVLAALLQWVLFEARVGKHAWLISSCTTFAIAIFASLNIPAYLYMGMSVYHFGTFLNVLAGLALYIRGLRKGTLQKPLTSIIFFLLAFSATISDALYLFQFSIPLLFVSLIATRINKKLKTLFHSVSNLVGSIAGYLFYSMLVPNPSRYPISLSLGAIPSHIAEAANLAVEPFLKAPLLSFCFSLIMLFVLVKMFRSVIRRKDEDRMPLSPFEVTSLTFLFGLIFTLSVSFLHSELPTSPRYLIPAFLFPIFLAFWQIYNWLSRKTLGIKFGSAALVGTLLFASVAYPIPAIKWVHRPQEIQCFERFAREQNLKFGAGEYWDAKYIQGLSEVRVTIAQYFTGYKKQQWITSDSFYKNQYDFLVVSNVDKDPYLLDVRELEQLSSEHSAVVNCGKFSVFAFKDGPAAIDRISQIGGRFTLNACQLGTKIATLDGKRCTYKVPRNHPAGHAFFGPYIDLAPGRYLLEANLELFGALGETDSLEVALVDKDTPKILGSTRLTLGKTENRPNVEFIVPDMPQENEVEFRLFLSNGAGVYFENLTLTRVG